MTIQDLLPTNLEAVGAAGRIPGDLDLRSQLNALRGLRTEHSDVADYITCGADGTAFYRTPWKLIRPQPPVPWGDRTPRLYPIYQDPLETQDRARDFPEVVRERVAAAEAFPVGVAIHGGLLDVFIDPDRFGGPEDREPGADLAHEHEKRNPARGCACSPRDIS